MSIKRQPRIAKKRREGIAFLPAWVKNSAMYFT
jgi:hypothetical protein